MPYRFPINAGRFEHRVLASVVEQPLSELQHRARRRVSSFGVGSLGVDLIHRSGSARARRRAGVRFREREGAREGFGRGKAGAALTRSPGFALGEKPDMWAGRQPWGSVVDSAKAKSFRVSQDSSHLSRSRKPGTYPLLGRRGRKEEARRRTLPTVEHLGQRARPFVATKPHTQSTLRIDAPAPAPHPCCPLPLHACRLLSIPGRALLCS